MYCTKCNINWAKLHEREQGDEVYEMCPNCRNDSHLVENIPGERYTMTPDGKLFDSKGNLVKPLQTVLNVKTMPEPKVFNRETWEAYLIEREQREDKYLAKHGVPIGPKEPVTA